MSSNDRFEDRLRQVLLAEAQTVTPAGDGLSQIRAKVARRDRLRWLRPGLAVATVAGLAGVAVFAASLTDSTSRTLKQDRQPTNQAPSRNFVPAPSPAPPPVTGVVYPIWPFTSRPEAQAWQKGGAGSQPWHLNAVQTALRFMGYLQAPEVSTVISIEPETTSVGAGLKVTLGRTLADGRPRAVTVVHLVRLGTGGTAPYVVTRAAGAYTLKITSPGIAAPVRSPLLVRGTIDAVGIGVRVELRTPSRTTPISAPAPEVGGNPAWSNTLRLAGGGNGIATLVARAELGDGALEITAQPVLFAAGANTSSPYPSTFAAASSGRIAVFDSTTGKLVRYLTTQQPGGGDSEPTVTADRRTVFFVRGAGTCTSGIWRVPYAGGPEVAVVNASSSLQWPASADNGRLLAYADTGCNNSPPAIVVDGAAAGSGNRISVPTGSSVSRLTLSSAYGLAFTMTTGAGSELRVLDPLTATSTATSRAVSLPQAGCSLASPTWAPAGLYAVATCVGGPGAGAELALFDARTLALVQLGPVLSDLGIGRLSADSSGNLIAQVGGGDTIGGMVVVSGGGIRSLDNGHCTSVDPTPYPCAVDADW